MIRAYSYMQPKGAAWLVPFGHAPHTDPAKVGSRLVGFCKDSYRKEAHQRKMKLKYTDLGNTMSECFDLRQGSNATFSCNCR